MNRAVWLMRALLAVLLAFMSEVFLWTSPDTRPLFDWIVLAFGYLALASFLLDLAARYRLRDPFGLLALVGVYGLLNAALLNPTSAFVDFPRTLFTRAMGGHTLMGLLAFALWFRLTGRAWDRRSFLPAGIAALVLGAVWGYWAHYSPPTFSTADVPLPPTPLITLLIVYAFAAAILLVVLHQLRRLSPSPTERGSRPPVGGGEVIFRLDRLSGGFVAVTFITLLTSNLITENIDGIQIAIVALFSLFCVGIVWFQKRQKGESLLDNRLPFLRGEAETYSPSPDARYHPALPDVLEETQSIQADADRYVPRPALVDGYTIALLILFLVAGIVGYHLPRPEADAADPLAVIGSLLTAYGLVWLPIVTFVLGSREFTKQSRAMRL